MYFIWLNVIFWLCESPGFFIRTSRTKVGSAVDLERGAESFVWSVVILYRASYSVDAGLGMSHNIRNGVPVAGVGVNRHRNAGGGHLLINHITNCHLSSQFMMFISESTTLGMRTTHQYIIIIYYDIQYLDFLSLTRGWNPWSCSQLYTHIMNKLTFLFYVNKYITTYRESEMESNWMWYWGVFYQYSRKSILVDLGTTTGSRMTNNSINSICYWV